MRNHLPQLPAGAERVATREIDHGKGDKTYLAVYRRPGSGETAVLVDQFKDGKWDAMFIGFEAGDELRKVLNRAHRERETE